MPAQDRVGLHEQDRLTSGSCHRARAEEHSPIDGAELRALDLPLEDQELLAQKQVFGNQRTARSGEIDDQADGRRDRSSGLANARYRATNAASDGLHEMVRGAVRHRPVMHRMLDRDKLVTSRNLGDSAADREVAKPGVDERCNAGHCEPIPCDDGYPCPADSKCAPTVSTTDGADVHGCIPLPCTEGWSCEADERCILVSNTIRSHGCAALACGDGTYECPPGTHCDMRTLGGDEHWCRVWCTETGCPAEQECLDDGNCHDRPCSADGDCPCGVCAAGACKPSLGVRTQGTGGTGG